MGDNHPVSQLQTFFNRVKLEAPVYTDESVLDADGKPVMPNKFRVSVHVPAVAGDGGFDAADFNAVDSSKKKAKVAVAEIALKYVQGFSIFHNIQNPDTGVGLWDVIKLTIDEMPKFANAELRVFAKLARDVRDDARLSTAVLLRCKRVMTWLTRADACAQWDLGSALTKLREELRKSCTGKSDDAFEISEDGEWIFIKEHSQPLSPRHQPSEPPPAAAGTAPLPLQVYGIGDDEEAACVMVPADVSDDIIEVKLPRHHAVLSGMAQLLCCREQDVIPWGAVGDKVALSHAAPPSDGGTGSAGAQHGSTPPSPQRDGAAAQHSAAVQHAQAAAANGTADDVEDSEDVSQHGTQGARIMQPGMYSTECLPDTPLNIRASWLAGRMVRGPAVISGVRFSIQQLQDGGKHTCMLWRHYTPYMYWIACTARFPCFQYAHMLRAPAIARLPKWYRARGSWLGTPPADLLRNHCRMFPWLQPPSFNTTSTNKGSVAFHSTATVTIPVEYYGGYGGATSVANGKCGGTENHACHGNNNGNDKVKSGDHGGAESGCNGGTGGGTCTVKAHSTTSFATTIEAEDDAALQLLHRLQQIYSSALTGQQPPHADAHDDVIAHDDIIAHVTRLQRELPPAPPSMEVVRDGDDAVSGAVALVGDTIDLHCRLEITGDNGSGDLVMSQQTRCIHGAHAVLPPLYHAAAAVAVDGVVRCEMDVSLEGPNILNAFAERRAVVEVTLAKVSRTPMRCSGTRNLFPKPGLAKLRHLMLWEMMTEDKPKVIVDVGCEKMKVLLDLWLSRDLDDYKDLVGCYGIDIDRRSLQVARRVLATKIAVRKQYFPDQKIPTFGLAADSAFSVARTAGGGWGAMWRPDLAIAQEVVEHLDPVPFRNFGAAMLGGMQPKVLVVTTPNRNYNAVLRHSAGVGAGPIGPDGFPFRHWDHRFEFTQQEFEDWARGIAEKFDYDVTFDGIGKAIDEESYIASICNDDGATVDVGYATQVAIFEHRNDGPPPQPPAAMAENGGQGLQLWWNSDEMTAEELRELANATDDEDGDGYGVYGGTDNLVHVGDVCGMEDDDF